MAIQASAATPSQLAPAAGHDWWRGAVIYQIYPRSFQDSNGDGVGDLPGITQRLSYVAGLGVDAIWLSPFFTSPMKDMGYDVADYCDVDPVFGTLDDFTELVAHAHELGLRVIIDQVLSHTSDEHPWFAESRQGSDGEKSDWYVWADARPDGTPPTNWQSIFGGPGWTWNPKRCQYYFHNFLSSQPDLNFHNPAVQDALLETVRFWLELGVDGFRLDTVNFYFHDPELRDNPPVLEKNGNDVPEINPYGFQEHVYDKTRPENIGFLKRFRALLSEYAGTTSVGEVGDGARSLRTMAEYTAQGDRLHMCYSFDMLSPEFSKDHFEECVEAFEAASQEYSDGASWPCWAFSNHDVMRHMSRWVEETDDHDQLAKLAGSLLLSLKGSVCIYQGEELGLTEAELQFEDLTDPYGINFWPEFKGRDGCRTPMVWESHAPHGGFSTADKAWLPVTDPHIAASANNQAGDPDSTLEHYRAFLGFRKSRPSLIVGDNTFMELDDNAIAFIRRADNEATLCVFNLSGSDLRLNLPAELNITALSNHGFDAEHDGSAIKLSGHQAFFAAVR
jgi:alpha-glucosidase